jgi:hypothetical protein
MQSMCHGGAALRRDTAPKLYAKRTSIDRAPATPMRLLVVNPNISAAMTVQPSFGPRSTLR